VSNDEQDKQWLTCEWNSVVNRLLNNVNIPPNWIFPPPSRQHRCYSSSPTVYKQTWLILERYDSVVQDTCEVWHVGFGVDDVNRGCALLCKATRTCTVTACRLWIGAHDGRLQIVTSTQGVVCHAPDRWAPSVLDNNGSLGKLWHYTRWHLVPQNTTIEWLTAVSNVTSRRRGPEWGETCIKGGRDADIVTSGTTDRSCLKNRRRAEEDTSFCCVPSSRGELRESTLLRRVFIALSTFRCYSELILNWARIYKWQLNNNNNNKLPLQP